MSNTKINLKAVSKPKEIIVYVSGKISGLAPELYKANFDLGVKDAREHFMPLAKKVTVINPLEITQIDVTDWALCMRQDIIVLMQCNAIFMLKGWQDSRGAIIERRIASDLGFNVVYQK